MFYNLLLLDAVIGFEKIYTYESEERLQKGQIVFVPFSTYKKPVRGIVVSQEMNYQGASRKIISSSGEGLGEKQLDVILQLAKEKVLSPAHLLRLHFPLGREKIDLKYHGMKDKEEDSIDLALKEGKVVLMPRTKRKKVYRKLIADDRTLENFLQSLSKANKRIPAYIEALKAGPLEHRGGLTAKQYKDLLDKKIVEEFLPLEDFQHRPKSEAFSWRREQSEVLDTFLKSQAPLHMLQGISGSGKTELSFEMAKAVLEEGKKVIFLVPNHFQIPQIAFRMASSLQRGVAVLSNLMKESEISAYLDHFHKGITPILVGTYSCLFTDLKDVGLIIVDESHDDAYQSMYPYFDTREYCKKLALELSVKTLFISATPRIVDRLDQRFQVHCLSYGKDDLQQEIQLVDMKKELLSGNISYLSTTLQEAMGNSQRTLLLLNQSGYYSYVGCRSCGHVMRCPHCEEALSYERDGKLHCRRCSYTENLPNKCPACQSTYFKYFRAGVKKLKETVETLFPHKKILTVEGSEFRNWQSLYDTVYQILYGDDSVVIGTHLIGKTLDIPFDVIGAVSIDFSLYLPGYMALESAFQSLTHLLGRGGRGRKTKIFLQTYTPEFPFFDLVKKQDYDTFIQEEIAYRKKNKLPPFVTYVLFQTVGDRSPQNKELLENLQRTLESLPVEMSLYPGRIKGTWNLLLVMDTWEEEYQELFMKWLKKYKDLRIIVDPLEIHL